MRSLMARSSSRRSIPCPARYPNLVSQPRRMERESAEQPARAGNGLLSSGVARMAVRSGPSRALTQCRQRERSACAPPVLHPEPVRYFRRLAWPRSTQLGWSRCRGRCMLAACLVRPGCGADPASAR
jgi:hypothetical protein